jgi:hypothetical protein
MVWIIVTGDTTEEGNISFGEGTSKGEGLTHLYGVKGDLQLLFELWACVWHRDFPNLFSSSLVTDITNLIVSFLYRLAVQKLLGISHH